MSNTKDVAMRYFNAFFGERDAEGAAKRFDDIRATLADDFRFSGPMMSAEGADDFIAKLRGFGDAMKMRADLKKSIVEDDHVVLLYDFVGPQRMPFFEVYRVEGDKIAEIQLSYDPRPFAEMMAGGS